MMIKDVSVEKLFGIFDHQINLKIEDRITIIHGPNGFGKTALLNLVNALLLNRISVFQNTPFKEFRVDYDDNSYIVVEKTERKNKKKLVFKLFKPGLGEQTFTPDSKKYNSVGIPLHIIEDIMPELTRTGYSSWINSKTSEEVNLSDVSDVVVKYMDQYPRAFNKENIPDWFSSHTKAIGVKFIETQRLLSLRNDRTKYNKKNSLESTVLTYSNELAAAIKTKLAESTSVYQQLERSFPERLIKQIGRFTDISGEAIQQKLKKLENKRTRLSKAGLLDKEVDLNIINTDEIDERIKNVLSLYLDDVETKLSFFDELLEKIELFQQIIKKRFQYKKLSIDREKGFIFNSLVENKDLSPKDLSSGEQHEIVLLYELLFNVNKNSLILIDEPELSLHVAWQKEFLGDLKRITEIIDSDVIIATHSPQIIHNRWDLTVPLKGPDIKVLDEEIEIKKEVGIGENDDEEISNP